MNGSHYLNEMKLNYNYNLIYNINKNNFLNLKIN